MRKWQKGKQTTRMIQAMSKKSTPSGMIINVCSFLIKDTTEEQHRGSGKVMENSIFPTLIIIIGH
jgi:hypothetical protein